MEPQESPRRNDVVTSPTQQGRHVQGSANRYRHDRWPPMYNEPIHNGNNNPHEIGRRSHSHERRSPLSIASYQNTSRALSPLNCEDVGIRETTEWKSCSHSDDARDKRTKQPEQYLVSIDRNPIESASRNSLEGNSRQRGELLLFLRFFLGQKCKI